MAGRGDELPVSALPVDGTYPSGTTRYEKRNISDFVAVWDSGSLGIDVVSVTRSRARVARVGGEG